MLPHPQGREHSVVHAFHACHRAFHDVDRSGLDDNAASWVGTIESLMDNEGVEAVGEEGTWMAKARTLSEDDLFELSRAVDEHAHWFDGEFWDWR